MRFERVVFKAQTLSPNGEEDVQRILNQNVFTTLFCQLSQPNLKQHRLPPTSQSSRRRLAAGGHQGCSRGTDSGESVFPDPDCQDVSLNSVWRVTWEMKALCGTSFPVWIRSPGAASTQHHLQHPDSSPQLCDVNANDISAMANMYSHTAPGKAAGAHDYINCLSHPEVTEATSEFRRWHNSQRRQERSASPQPTTDFNVTALQSDGQNC